MTLEDPGVGELESRLHIVLVQPTEPATTLEKSGVSACTLPVSDCTDFRHVLGWASSSLILQAGSSEICSRLRMHRGETREWTMEGRIMLIAIPLGGRWLRADD